MSKCCYKLKRDYVFPLFLISFLVLSTDVMEVGIVVEKSAILPTELQWKIKHAVTPSGANSTKILITGATIINGKRTEWSPIRSVIIQMIEKITAKRESDLLITSMITDSIGRHEVLYQLIIIITNFRKAKKCRKKLGKIFSVETLSKVTKSSILEKAPDLKGKLLSCYNDWILCCDWWI